MSNPAPAAGGDHATGAAAKVNKPSNSNFRQQRLVAWQPIMNPPHVVACLTVVAIAFIPIGIAIIFADKDVTDIEIRYDDRGAACSLTNNDGLFTYTPPGATLPTVRMGCRTYVNFSVPKEMKAPIYMYYKLTNFYQNHRRFAKSRSESQLAGTDASGSTISDCAPFRSPGENNGQGDRQAAVNGVNQSYSSFTYSPCGLVAWSQFNDSFVLYQKQANSAPPLLICNGSAFTRDGESSNTTANQQCHKKGITWSSDSDKFKIPYLSDSIWAANRAVYGAGSIATTDEYLAKGWYADEPGHLVPSVTDEDLQVWMRTAALPTFRKLYRVIDVNLPAGDYIMVIDQYFPVESFSGTKSFALSTLSWLGGENSFLGIAYIVVGSVTLLLAVIFLVAYKANGDRMQQAIDSLSELQ